MVCGTNSCGNCKPRAHLGELRGLLHHARALLRCRRQDYLRAKGLHRPRGGMGGGRAQCGPCLVPRGSAKAGEHSPGILCAIGGYNGGRVGVPRTGYPATGYCVLFASLTWAPSARMTLRRSMEKLSAIVMTHGYPRCAHTCRVRAVPGAARAGDRIVISVTLSTMTSCGSAKAALRDEPRIRRSSFSSAQMQNIRR